MRARNGNGHPAWDGGRVGVFRYAVAEKAELYRVLVEVFSRAKARYRIQLRAEEVRSELPAFAADLPLEELAAALDQLAAWGNLKRTQDTREVATLDEFYHRRSLYQLTPEGEEAHRGVTAVLELFSRSGGRLSGVMLPKIEEDLGALLVEWRSGSPDAAKLYHLLVDLNASAVELAENARRFMNDLSESLESVAETDESFLTYKRAILAYLERFVGILARHQPRIAALLAELDAAAGAGLLDLAATADEAPSPTGQDRGPVTELRARWDGLSRWFLGAPGRPAEAEHLRGAAVAAVNRILRVLEQLNERRYRRVNRTADFMRLARWFARAGSPRDAAALFDLAFGLFSARHLSAPCEDEEEDRGKSFFEAAPVVVAPRLRRTGRRAVPGRAAAVPDYGASKRDAIERVRAEEARSSRAAGRFLGRTLRLSELGRLERPELSFLLGALDAALRSPPDREGRLRATIAGGGYRVLLELPDGSAVASVETDGGSFLAPDFRLTVSPRRARAGRGGRRS